MSDSINNIVNTEITELKKEISEIRTELNHFQNLFENKNNLINSLFEIKKYIDTSTNMTQLLDCIHMLNQITKPSETDIILIIQLLNCCLINKMAKLSRI